MVVSSLRESKIAPSGHRGYCGSGTPAAFSALVWRRCSALTSKSAISSWNSRYQLISA
jgi:hypothetical protein